MEPQHGLLSGHVGKAKATIQINMPVITVHLQSNYPWNDQVEKINFWSAFRLGIL